MGGVTHLAAAGEVTKNKGGDNLGLYHTEKISSGQQQQQQQKETKTGKKKTIINKE